MDIELLNTKIWVNNDRDLIRRIELLAFSQGFGWLKVNYPDEYIYKKHTELKNIYGLYFSISRQGNRFITQRNTNWQPITKYYTHKNKFDSIKNSNQIVYGCNYDNKLTIELFPKDIFKEKTVELWI